MPKVAVWLTHASSIAPGRSRSGTSRQWSAPSLPADDETVSIGDLAALDSAGPEDISVFTGVRYLGALAQTRAGAIIISRKLAHHAAPIEPPPLCRRPAPRLRPGRAPLLSAADARSPAPTPRQRASERLHRAGTQIDPGAVIGRDVDIGERCHIGPNVVIGDGVLIGDDCRIGANCAISHALIGHRVEIETCVTIGSQGFGFVPGPAGLKAMLQLGRVVIEEGVKIGANCAIDRGATEDTVIGAGSVLDNLVHIGHNVRLGRHCVICGQVGIAGSTVVGDGVMMGGQTGVADHLTIGTRAQIAAKSGVMRNVEPGPSWAAFPQWRSRTGTARRSASRACRKRSSSAASSPHLRQRLLQVGDDVGLVLDADRQAHHVGPGAGRRALLIGELAVRRRRRMDDEAARVADVGEVREQLERSTRASTPAS